METMGNRLRNIKDKFLMKKCNDKNLVQQKPLAILNFDYIYI